MGRQYAGPYERSKHTYMDTMLQTSKVAQPCTNGLRVMASENAVKREYQSTASRAHKLYYEPREIVDIASIDLPQSNHTKRDSTIFYANGAKNLVLRRTIEHSLRGILDPVVRSGLARSEFMETAKVRRKEYSCASGCHGMSITATLLQYIYI